jgi:predicted transcriptional regulator
MGTDWGKQPRSMNEIKEALKANALHFSKGTLSGTLTTMTKRGDIRRMKKDRRWKYLAK